MFTASAINLRSRLGLCCGRLRTVVGEAGLDRTHPAGLRGRCIMYAMNHAVCVPREVTVAEIAITFVVRASIFIAGCGH